MRILLIDPPFYRFLNQFNRYFPYGLAALSAFLSEATDQVSVLDADYNAASTKMNHFFMNQQYPSYLEAIQNDNHFIWQEIRAHLASYQPDLVGITVMTAKVASAFKIAQICKEILPKTRLVFGGPHPSIAAEEIILNCPEVDFLIQGEGEFALKDLVGAINNSKKNFDNIAGLSFRKNSKIYQNPKRKTITNLDDLPIPYRESLHHKRSYTSEDLGLMMATRGCPFDCGFCSSKGIWGQKLRQRSITSILGEILFLKEFYKVKFITFKDDCFAVDKSRIFYFCEELTKAKFKIFWEANLRADLLTPELLKIMRESGCRSIKVGVESGSPRILELIDKKIDLVTLKKSAQALNDSKIFWTAYFLMGIPTETEEDMLQTINLLNILKPSFASVSLYEPFPKTKLFDLGLDLGLYKPTMSYQDFFNTFPNCYYLADPNRRSDVIEPEQFKELEDKIKKHFHSYNKKAQRWIKRIFSRGGLYFSDPKLLASDFKKFKGWI